MLDKGQDDLEDVIELSDDDADPPRSRAGATLVSAAEQAAARAQVDPQVEVIGGEPPSDERVTGALPAIELEPEAEEAIAASERQIAALRDALSRREDEVHALRDELLQRERELTLLRSLRPPPPSKRLAAPSSAPSSLGVACARFFVEALERTVEGGWRSALDFHTHFPPGIVMRRLDRHPAVRATYLTLLVGIPERTALRTATDDAGRLLQTAVDARDCEPASYVRIFQRTATSNYLDPATVWSFLIDEELIRVAWQSADERYPAAQRQVALLTELALAHRMIGPDAVVDGLGPELVAECLPAERLTSVLRGILEAGRSGRPFTDDDLVAAVPPAELCAHVPLAYLVEGVLVPVARAAGFVTSLPEAP